MKIWFVESYDMSGYMLRQWMLPTEEEAEKHRAWELKKPDTFEVEVRKEVVV